MKRIICDSCGYVYDEDELKVAINKLKEDILPYFKLKERNVIIFKFREIFGEDLTKDMEVRYPC